MRGHKKVNQMSLKQLNEVNFSAISKTFAGLIISLRGGETNRLGTTVIINDVTLNIIFSNCGTATFVLLNNLNAGLS